MNVTFVYDIYFSTSSLSSTGSRILWITSSHYNTFGCALPSIICTTNENETTKIMLTFFSHAFVKWLYVLPLLAMVSLSILFTILAVNFIVNHFIGHSLTGIFNRLGFFSASIKVKLAPEGFCCQFSPLQMGKINYSSSNRRLAVSKAVIFFTIDN